MWLLIRDCVPLIQCSLTPTKTEERMSMCCQGKAGREMVIMHGSVAAADISQKGRHKWRHQS